LLKKYLRAHVISLPLFDVTHVEQARSVAGIEFEAGFEVFASFVEASKMPVREAHKA